MEPAHARKLARVAPNRQNKDMKHFIYVVWI